MITPNDIKIKFKINKQTIIELYNFIQRLDQLNDDISEVFIKHELQILRSKIFNKINVQQITRSITLNYYQMLAINYLYKHYSTNIDQLVYPGVIQLISDCNSKIDIQKNFLV